MTVNEEKLNAFLGKVVGDVGAAMSAALVVDRRPARSLQGARRRRPADPGRAREEDGDRRAVRPRVAERAGGRRLRGLRPGERPLPPRARAGDGARGRDEPRVGARTLPRGLRDVARRGEDHGQLPHGRGPRVGGSAHVPLRGHGAVLPRGVHRQPDERVDPVARRREDEARGGREGRRRGLRARGVDHPDGEGVPEVEVLRLRLAPQVDRAGSPARGAGQGRGPRLLRGGQVDGLSGQRLRSRRALRLSPRHGRPRGRGEARARRRSRRTGPG